MNAFLSIRLYSCAAIAALALVPFVSTAQTFVQPYAPTFSPTGTSSEPWTVLNAAAAASNGGVVQILGSTPFYGPNRIDKPCKLTRLSAAGVIKIGAAPIAQTTFRCISYNARLNGQIGTIGVANFLPFGWADAARTEAIRQQIGNFAPDFAGFCEVWNSDWYDSGGTGLKYIGGMPYGMTGFSYNGFGTHHSGLCAVSKAPLNSPLQYTFSNYTGEDGNSAKGWIQATTAKDGFQILVVMTHTQADSTTGATWNGIFTARRQQMEQIRSSIELFRVGNPSAIVVLMGDFNVYAEDRTPANSTGLTTEYSSNMKPALSAFSLDPFAGPAPRDVAKQFSPQMINHTYSFDPVWGENSLISYFDSGYANPTYSGRLDYFFVWNSFDRKVVVEPSNYQVLKLMSNPPISGGRYPNAGTLTDANLSDHYAIMGDFRIMRISN